MVVTKAKCVYINPEIEEYDFTLNKIYECIKVWERRINLYDDSGYYWHCKRLDGKLYRFEIIE